MFEQACGIFLFIFLAPSLTIDRFNLLFHCRIWQKENYYQPLDCHIESFPDHRYHQRIKAMNPWTCEGHQFDLWNQPISIEAPVLKVPVHTLGNGGGWEIHPYIHIVNIEDMTCCFSDIHRFSCLSQHQRPLLPGAGPGTCGKWCHATSSSTSSEAASVGTATLKNLPFGSRKRRSTKHEQRFFSIHEIS